MPSLLKPAVPVGVLPQTLSLSFVESRLYPMLAAQYHDGETERALLTDGVNPAVSLRTWKLNKRLTAAQIATLKAFWDAHVGGLAYYFYNPFEPASGQAIGSNYDATGVSTQGRHVCQFTTQVWTEGTGIAFSDVQIEFHEVM